MNQFYSYKSTSYGFFAIFLGQIWDNLKHVLHALPDVLKLSGELCIHPPPTDKHRAVFVAHLIGDEPERDDASRYAEQPRDSILHADLPRLSALR